jgi:hypothetical protein
LILQRSQIRLDSCLNLVLKTRKAQGQFGFEHSQVSAVFLAVEVVIHWLLTMEIQMQAEGNPVLIQWQTF